MMHEATQDRGLIRADGGSRRYVKFVVAAPAARDERARAPANLAVVVDRSGSMHGSKIEYARAAALQTVKSLRDGDRLSLVAYDTEVDVLLPSTRITATTRQQAISAVAELMPRASTNLCEGWMRGCEQIGNTLEKEQVGRALLMSDGLANRGITDAAEIANHAAALRARGVSTSTFGIGRDFDEVLLSGMSESGGGNFYYVEQAEQIPDFVASEVGESLDVVARDAALIVHAPEGVSVRSLNGYPAVRDANRWRIELGALVSRQHLEAALELRFPSGEQGDAATVTLKLDDADDVLDAAAVPLDFRYAGHRDNDRQPRNVEVDRLVATLFAAMTRRQGLALNREGRFEEAEQVMLACARRIDAYAGDDAELASIKRGLITDGESYNTMVTALEMKRAYASSTYMSRARSSKGSSLRR